MKKIILAIIFLFLSSPGVSEETNWADWSHLAPITGSVTREMMLEVKLTPEVFNLSKNKLNDLRISDDSGEEIPLMLLVSQPSESVEPVPIKITTTPPDPRKGQCFILDASPLETWHNEIIFHFEETDFHREVIIEESDNGQFWQRLLSGGEIFQVQADDLIFKTKITYPTSKRPYLKVSLGPPEKPPLTLTGLALTLREPIFADENAITMEQIKLESDSSKSQIRILFDTHQNKLPISRVTIKPEWKNFILNTQLLSGNNKDNLEFVARESLFWMDTSLHKGENLSIKFPPLAHRFFELQVQAEDDLPVPIKAATAYFRTHKILFPSLPGKKYFLYLGNKKAEGKNYNFSPFLSLTDKIQISSLGNFDLQKKNKPKVKPLPKVTPLTQEKPFKVSPLYLLAGLVLCFIIGGYRLKNPPKKK